MGRFSDDSAALAANWRTILLVDAAVGWALVLAGFVAAGAFEATVVGSLLVGAGVAYLLLGLRRARRWRRLRADAGLDT